MEGADAPRSSARRGARPGDSCPIAELPNELLSAIFDLIPYRPRLLAVSTVCRLWRDVVLRLITRLAPARRSRHSPPIDDLLALFPSLTELNTSDHSELTLQLPTSLKRLDVDSSARWHIHAPASLPNLQSLGLSCRSIEQHDAAAVIAHIMAASAASITDLRISFPSPMQGTKLVEYLNATRFPSLRSLAVAPDAEEMDLGPFFQRHLTQLTRLRASILRFTDDAPGNLWPLTALKTLEVTELLVVDEAETVEDLLCRFPCLTALSLCGVTQLVAPTRTPSPLSALTELTFDTRMAISTEPAAMSSLAQVATRLRALNLIPAIGDNGLHERIGAFEARRWLTFVTSMELSEIESETSIELVFRSCPNLAQLTLLDTSITCVTTAIERVESAKLLRLKVNNAMARHSLESVIALWRLALARFRNLHTLSLTVGAKPSRAAMAELRKLVQQSAVHGIGVLELSLVEELRDELSTEWIRVTRQE